MGGIICEEDEEGEGDVIVGRVVGLVVVFKGDEEGEDVL